MPVLWPKPCSYLAYDKHATESTPPKNTPNKKKQQQNNNKATTIQKSA